MVREEKKLEIKLLFKVKCNFLQLKILVFLEWHYSSRERGNKTFLWKTVIGQAIISNSLTPLGNKEFSYTAWISLSKFEKWKGSSEQMTSKGQFQNEHFVIYNHSIYFYSLVNCAWIIIKKTHTQVGLKIRNRLRTNFLGHIQDITRLHVP